MYEDIDAKWIIKQQLYDIKQSESAFKYIIAFQLIAAKIKWNDLTFTAQFYKELKNEIKNEIAHINKLATLHVMISKTIVLNNRQYKRRLEKKNKITYASVAWSKGKKKQQLYYDSRSMKLDAIRKILNNTWNSHRRIISTQQLIISQKCMMRKVMKVCLLWLRNQRFSTAKHMTQTDQTALRKLFIKQSKKKIDLAKFYEHLLLQQKMLSSKKKIVLK